MREQSRRAARAALIPDAELEGLRRREMSLAESNGLKRALS